VTLTTVGDGDVSPTTTPGKLVAGVSILLGVGLFALPAGVLASGFAEEQARSSEPPSPPKTVRTAANNFLNKRSRTCGVVSVVIVVYHLLMRSLILVLCGFLFSDLLLAQPASSVGAVAGTVTLAATGKPVHHASVLVLPLGRVVESDDNGRYQFPEVPAGRYTLVATVSGLSGDRLTVTVAAGATAAANFVLAISPLRQEITVTASGRLETAVETFSSVASLDTLELSTKAAASLGDVLDGQPGVAKRSFGPGTGRPVLRGFDGDRVLIMQDGVRTGSLSSQSGDHGEPLDPQALERVEVVRGPATLLYGSNAIGGVVNMITGHHEAQSAGHEGLHGYLSGIGGSNNGLHGGSAGLDYGVGQWVFRMGSGGQRTADYRTPVERIFNSAARTYSGQAGVARYGERAWFNLSYNTQRGTYQVPNAESGDHHEEEGHSHESVRLPFTRQGVRLAGGLRSLNRPIEGLQYSYNYTDWRHNEVSGGEIENRFYNKQGDYRLVVEQRRSGRLSGSFGGWGLRRDYKVIGAEAITPPVVQNALAAFVVETLTISDRVRMQFGTRLENNRFRPERLTSRSFTGLSGSVGINATVWDGGVFVANYNHSYRAPALEELYANGPHVGNLTYEIGSSKLRRERGDGLDLSLRHTTNRVRAELNYFYYRMRDFVFLAPTGEEEDGLLVAEYSQANSRYMGIDGRLQAGLHRNVWLNLGFDTVQAELTGLGTPLPRIPPVRGRVGVDLRAGRWSVLPEVVMANQQTRTFTNETPTAGFALFNLRGAYTVTTQHTVHLFGVNLFNTGNRLYRNHLSFIKDVAPEIGRGVSFSYSVRFF